MTYIYIEKPRPDRGIYKIDDCENGVIECTRLKTGVSEFLFNEEQAQPVAFHHFLSERFQLLEDKGMKVNMTVQALIDFVEEWEEFKKGL